uniref:Fibrinogen C-terminal domain-containing protein n=1 Tax=Musca domestica TaxID=7370 RepID=A0A1I8MQJ2_MUSDO
YSVDESRILRLVDNVSSESKEFLQAGLMELQKRQDLQEENMGNLIETVTLKVQKSMEENLRGLEKRFDDQEMLVTNIVEVVTMNTKKYMEEIKEELGKRQELGVDRFVQLIENISLNTKDLLESGFSDLKNRQDDQEEKLASIMQEVKIQTQQSMAANMAELEKRLDNQDVQVASLIDSLRKDSQKYMDGGFEEIRQRLLDQEGRVVLTLQNATEEAQKLMDASLEGVKQRFNKVEESQNTQHDLSLQILKYTTPKPYSFKETADIISLNQHREWMTISRRLDGSVAFDLGWEDYKTGFGNPNGEFFLGLEKLHALTTYGATQELLVVLKDHQNQTRYAKYDIFRVGSELENYAILELGYYSGDAGDSLRYHAGASFVTKDNNNGGNFPAERGGGWWRSVQSMCDLHSYYEPVDNVYGIFWGTWNGWKYTLKSAEMMIRSKA